MDCALSLARAHGMSAIRSCVLNLTNDEGARFLFVSSNTAVIQVIGSGSQTVLQGHTNPITCVTSSFDNSIVITADVGPSPMLVVWDTKLEAPQLKVPAPHKYGVRALDMHSQSCLLATLSDTSSEAVAQEISLWDLSNRDQCKNLITVPIPAGDLQELISNGNRRAFFWQSCLPASAAFKYYSPPLSSADFKQSIGTFTASMFIPGTSQAITGTEDGDVVVWDHQGISAEIGTRHTDRKAIKIMRLHCSRITWLSAISNFIVTGAEDGHVRFFDPMLRLIAWFEHISAGSIHSVSFSKIQPSIPKVPPFDTFLCPDFLVGTNSGAVIKMTANAFNTAHDEHRTGEVVMEGLVGDIVACFAHPAVRQFVLIGKTGALQIWETTKSTKTLSKHLNLNQAAVTSVTQSRNGALLVVGCSNGAVYIVNGANLCVIERFKYSRAAITAVSVCPKAQNIIAATADGFTQLMFLVSHKSIMRWEYIGRTKVHYSPIVTVQFGEAPSGELRCFSLGRDGRLVEYKVSESTLEKGVIVGEQVTACLDGSPTAMCFTPVLAYFQRGVIDTHIIIADSSYHMRVFNPDSAVATSTYRSPTCSDPVSQMIMFRDPNCDLTLIAFSFEYFRSNSQAAGVMMWPTDGHPASIAAVLAHPGELASISVCCDGSTLLTASKDGHVNQWSISSAVLKHRASAAGTGAERWQHLLGDDITLDEVQRFFLLSQVRADGDNVLVPREVKEHVPLDSIPELMCALGYYPSRAEVTDMISSLVYAATIRKEPRPDSVSLERLLCLYYNFVPVCGVELGDLQKAFVALGAARADCGLSAGKMKETLTGIGEPMDAVEMSEALRILTGKDSLAEADSTIITPKEFACDILGFEPAPGH